MDIRERVAYARTVIFEKPVFLVAMCSLYLLVVMGVYTYIYNGNPFEFYANLPLWFTLVSSILNVLISIALGITLALSIAQLQFLRAHSAGLGIVSVLFGGLAMGCPGCFFGLFPLVLGFFGITGTLAILPWNGIEFQILTLVLMLLSAFSLAKDPAVCEQPRKKPKRK